MQLGLGLGLGTLSRGGPGNLAPTDIQWPNEYTPAPGELAAFFDQFGVNTMERASALTGASGEYTKYLLSCWHYIEPPLTSSVFRSFGNGFFNAKVNWSANLALQVDAYDSSFNGDTIDVPMTAPMSAQWVHVLVAYDSENESATKAAINGALVEADIGFFNEDPPTLAGEDNFVVGPDLVGKLSECYLAFGQWLDLTNPANIAKFISGGLPVDLGADGSTPTGSPPTIYFGNGDFANNLGTGGDFMVQSGEGFEPVVSPGPAA